MAAALGVEDYRALISDALPNAQDADTVEPELKTLFTPDTHRRALEPDTTVVRGGRGVGKTFWFRSLLNPELRSVAAQEYRIDRLRRLEVAAGYGADLDPDRYPGSGELPDLVDGEATSYDIWNTVLLAALGQPDLADIREWKDRIAWVQANRPVRDRTIAEADKRAQSEGKPRLILFDALERLHRDRDKTDELVAGILQLALEMRLSTKNIRCKVFIRPDMFDGASLLFPDASKLTSNEASLQWTQTNLYGLFFHYLGNEGSGSAAEFRAAQTGWEKTEEGRHVPPPALMGDGETQSAVFTSLAGPYMGANFRKGHTYTWLPNHLMDGTGQVSPRSFLNALSIGVAETATHHAAHEYAIHHDGIRRGVQSASKTRVDEIREDLPWVETAVNPLEGQQVPIEQDVVVGLWTDHNLTETLRAEAERTANVNDVRTGPRYPDRYPALIEELIELGVMRRRTDGRIDLPDVYRIAFSIGRKGGVPKVKP